MEQALIPPKLFQDRKKTIDKEISLDENFLKTKLQFPKDAEDYYLIENIYPNLRNVAGSAFSPTDPRPKKRPFAKSGAENLRHQLNKIMDEQ